MKPIHDIIGGYTVPLSLILPLFFYDCMMPGLWLAAELGAVYPHLWLLLGPTGNARNNAITLEPLHIVRDLWCSPTVASCRADHLATSSFSARLGHIGHYHSFFAICDVFI